MAKLGTAGQSGFRLGGAPPPPVTDDRQPSGGRAQARMQSSDLGGTGIEAGPAPTPEVDATDASGGGHSTRSFAHTWDTQPSVGGPMGPMNTGYVSNVVGTNGQWSRGELPESGYGYTFALRRPKFMREPRTDLGSYNFARG